MNQMLLPDERALSNELSDIISDICRNYRYNPYGRRCLKNTLIKKVDTLKDTLRIVDYNINLLQTPYDISVRRTRIEMTVNFDFQVYTKDVEYLMYVEY